MLGEGGKVKREKSDGVGVFWCHPEIRQQTVSLDLQAESWKDLFCLRKFMRHWEAEGQLGGSGERPELLRVGLRQRWGNIG